MDKNEIIETLETIADGMDRFADGQSTMPPSEYYPEIIRSLCIAVASLISKHPPDKMRSTKYIKEAFAKYKDNIEKEIIFSVIEDINYDL